MPKEKKDKYEELEELPVEAVQEPFKEAAEPGAAPEQREPEARGAPQAPPASGETESEVGKKIEAAASVRDAAEYLRGQKHVKIIKKSAIKGIVDSIIKSYSGMEHQELLSKIAEYEFNISNLRQDRKKLKEELERLLSERQTLVDEVATRYEKEIEELRARLASAEKLLSQDSSKEKIVKLEQEILRLKQRVKELEQGLEFAAVVEEYDYGMVIESAAEQKQKIAEINKMLGGMVEAEPDRQGPKALKELLTAIDQRYELLTDLFKRSQRAYSEGLKKVDEKEGSVGVVAELIRLNARNRGWSKELSICGEFVQSAEATVKGK